MDTTTARTSQRARRGTSGQKVSGGLKELASYVQSDDLLAKVKAWRLKQVETGRRQDVIHPSEMAKSDWCPRQTYYRIRDTRAGKEIPTEYISAQLDNIFEEGNRIHAKWQGWLGSMGILWGNWFCTLCEKTHRDQTIPTACPKCGDARFLTYREIPLDAEATHLIRGHADGGIESLTTMIEIKSVGLGTLRMEAPSLVRDHTVRTEDGRQIVDHDGLWKSIKRPLPSHLRQGNIYLWIARQMNLPFTTMTYIYESKATQATKCFQVPLSTRIMDPLLTQAATITDGLRNATPPRRPTTHLKDKKPCTSCVFKTECWECADEPPRQLHRGRRVVRPRQ